MVYCSPWNHWPLRNWRDYIQHGGTMAMLGMIVMPITTLSLLVSTASAQAVYNVFPAQHGAAPTLDQPARRSQPALVTLSVRDSTIDYVTHEIARQGHLHLINNGTSSAFTKRITVHIVKAIPLDALTQALRGTGLTARVAPDGETVMLRMQTDATSEHPAASGTITGLITDSATGRPVADARVTIQDSKLSTRSAGNGTFELTDVPEGERVLVIRAFSYRQVFRTVTVTADGPHNVRITLAQLPTMLSGLVTTATGQEQRMRVGNDITVINADSVMNIAPVTSVTDLLATRVPGLIVMPTSGVPGAPSRIRIRGTSSPYSSNDPIVIVDGVRVYADQSGSSAGDLGAVNSLTTVRGGSGISASANSSTAQAYVGPSPLDQINPSSIDKIEVLKGPSASALYGSDAANGVIIITTKQGHAGPPRWTVTLDQGRSTQPGDWPVHYFRFGQVQAATPGSASSLCSPYLGACVTDSVVTYQALNDSRVSPLKTGRNQSLSLGVSGGVAALSYAINGQITDQTGILKLPDAIAQSFQTAHGFAAPKWMREPDDYGMWGGNSRLGVQLGQSGSTIQLSNILTHSNQQQSSLNAGDALAALSGAYVTPATLGTSLLSGQFSNRFQGTGLTSTNALTLSNWRLRSWLPLSATVGLNFNATDNNQVTPRNYVNNSDFLDDTMGYYGVSRQTVLTRTLDASTTIGQSDAFVTLPIGINVHEESQSGFQAQTIGLPIGALQANNFFYTNGGPSQQVMNTATYGWYVAPQFNLHSRLFVSPGIRLDGGSASGTHSQLNPFPRMDLSYIAVDRRDDRPLLGALTLLRPHFAYGIAGVQPPSAAQLRLYNPITVIPAGTTTPVTIAPLVSYGNTQLHPERSLELEGGVDVDLWRSRLTLGVTQYHKMRYDAIVPVPIALSVGNGLGVTDGNGALTQAKNVGRIRNTGTDATITARLVDQRFLQWNANALFTKNNSRVMSLVNGQPPITIERGKSVVRIQPGYPLNAVFARPIVSYSDVNHDGLITAGEVRLADSVAYVGPSEPNYELNLSTSLAFLNGRLSVNTAVSYQNGLVQLNSAATHNSFGSGLNGFNELLLIANDPKLSTAQQAAIAAYNGYGLSGSAIGLLQAVNTLRWTSLSINYQMPTTMARVFRASSMVVALQGSNLGLHTNYRGLDPDVNGNTGGNLTEDSGQLPKSRLWSLHIMLGN